MPRKDCTKRRGWPLEHRFWDQVEKSPDADGCWIWVGTLYENGYGQIGIDGKTRKATHIAWELTYGETVPKGMFVCHDCPNGDNKACVRPDHLYLGTPKQNAEDAMRKGQLPVGRRHWAVRSPERVPRGERHWAKREPERRKATAARGERHGKSRFTEQDVRDILRRHASGESIRGLMRAYSCSQCAIQSIVHRKTWRHVTID